MFSPSGIIETYGWVYGDGRRLMKPIWIFISCDHNWILLDDVLSSNRPESLSALPETQTTQPKLTTNFVTEDDHYKVEGFNAVHQLSAGNRGDNGFFTGKPANFPSLFDLVGEFSHNKRNIHPQRRNSSWPPPAFWLINITKTIQLKWIT